MSNYYKELKKAWYNKAAKSLYKEKDLVLAEIYGLIMKVEEDFDNSPKEGDFVLDGGVEVTITVRKCGGLDDE